MAVAGTDGWLAYFETHGTTKATASDQVWRHFAFVKIEQALVIGSFAGPVNVHWCVSIFELLKATVFQFNVNFSLNLRHGFT